MSGTERLSNRVAAAAFVTFLASSLFSPTAWGQPEHTPKFEGKRPGSAIANIVRDLRNGGLVIVFSPTSGEINAYAVDGPNVTVVEDGPSPPSGVSVLGRGQITDILIYKGSDCVTTLLNGKRVTVCNN